MTYTYTAIYGLNKKTAALLNELQADKVKLSKVLAAIYQDNSMITKTVFTDRASDYLWNKTKCHAGAADLLEIAMNTCGMVERWAEAGEAVYVRRFQ